MSETVTLATPPATRSRRMVSPAVTIGALTLATVALHLRDPHDSGSWGYCPLYEATGIYCPGCGGLRAVNDLGNGHLGAALSSNIVVTLMIPVAVFGLLVWARDRWTGTQRQTNWQHVQRYTACFVALLVVFAVVRNLAFGAWLAP